MYLIAPQKTNQQKQEIEMKKGKKIKTAQETK